MNRKKFRRLYREERLQVRRAADATGAPSVVDDLTRECLILVPDTSLPGVRVVRGIEANR